MVYKNEALNEISFPLGGIGTGSIGLAGNGSLVDWEIYNRPNKGSINNYTHMAVKVKKDGKNYCKVLQGDIKKDLLGRYTGANNGLGFGVQEGFMAGFPHFKECTFKGEFPIASIDFADDNFPGKVTLTAFNPMIPLDSDNSSIPAAFFEVAYTNTGDSDVAFESAFSLRNPYGVSKNTAFSDGKIKGVKLQNAELKENEYGYGDLSLTCDDPTQVQVYWYRGGWRDSIVTYWNEFTSDEPFLDRNYEGNGTNDLCTIIKDFTVPAGETRTARFIISWNVPRYRNYWCYAPEEEKCKFEWNNYYTKLFADSTQSGIYSIKNWDNLYSRTLDFKNTLFASTVDPAVIDAASATMSVLKTATVLRLEDGEFYGFEGMAEHYGCCEGTCQHVYNYAYALCFLFPDLERTIRDLEFEHATYKTGATEFRVHIPPTEPRQPWRSCVDGQMGCVIKAYREWKISGDNEWLKKVWPTVKLVLEYAWSEENPDEWDRDKDGVLEGRQHHTLDMELFGPSSWLQGFYLLALSCAAEIAEFLGEPDKAAEYMEVYEKGKKWTKENLFNGEYFVQKIDLTNKGITDHFGCSEHYWNDETGEIKYQICEGSEIDQLCGQWHANICGLPRIFDDEQVDTALRSMLKNNFKPSMREIVNSWRVFTLNDESGTVMCDYPEGAKKPKIPLTYSEECMHGFEYAFAGLLISEGFIDEGLMIVKSVRDRYQGYNRNPWNEIECGSNYVRSMASFALLPIFSGFIFDLPHGIIGFDPKVNTDNYNCIFSLGTGWGNVEIIKEKTTVKIHEGSLKLCEIRLPYIKGNAVLKIDGKEVATRQEGGVLYFDKTLCEKTIEVVTA